MKLPNGDHAIVDIRKLVDYCLNTQHPRGRNKARVFASVGIREADADELRMALFAAATGADAQLGVWLMFMDNATPSISSCSGTEESLESEALGLCGLGTTCRG